MDFASARNNALAVALVVAVASAAPAAAATSARAGYLTALGRESVLRGEWQQSGDSKSETATIRRARSIVMAYEAVVRVYPGSGYTDNALWQGAMLEADLFARTGQQADRQKAIALFQFLVREYPASPFVKRALEEVRRLTKPEPTRRAESREAQPPATTTLRDIRRTVLPEVVRVSIEIDRQVIFHQERVENPARLLFDLPATKAAPAIQDANLKFDDDVVREIRVGRHPNTTTRVVLDLEGVSRYSVVTLANPYRILIDCERQAPPVPALSRAGERRLAPAETGTGKPAALPNPPAPVANEQPRRTPANEPEDPPATSEGRGTGRDRVSMARQLGLGVSRIVIDPGHGGHDPGAEGARTTEAQIVLDIALRVEKLLTREQGIDVVLTRRTDIFVPLEERTAIANREQADLFLSIHANASRNARAQGIESYYLNFATNPEAEAVAARENATSARTMNNLPEIVKAIALNNKLNESKDLAALVQQSLAKRLRQSNKGLKDLGVKQAPFVVLIGAAMPSVLAEVSFLTNKREGQLLKSDAYRQRIAEALCDAVTRYRRTLKGGTIVAHQEN